MPFRTALISIVYLFAFTTGMLGTPDSNIKKAPSNAVETTQKQVTPKVTFIELGSVNCVPCKMMATVMESLEKKYPKDIKITFYDVWTDAGKPMGPKYGIRAIPTQIFLDGNGKEFSRHEGFFPEEEIIKILKTKGVAE